MVIVKCSFKDIASTASQAKYELNNEDQSLYVSLRKAAPRKTYQKQWSDLGCSAKYMASAITVGCAKVIQHYILKLQIQI